MKKIKFKISHDKFLLNWLYKHILVDGLLLIMTKRFYYYQDLDIVKKDSPLLNPFLRLDEIMLVSYCGVVFLFLSSCCWKCGAEFIFSALLIIRFMHWLIMF